MTFVRMTSPYIPKFPKTTPKTELVISHYLDPILHGTLLSIDPSIGSRSSSCGYAVFNCGELQECGDLRVNISGTHSERLYELRQLLEKFERPDILVIEQISFFGKSTTKNRKDGGPYTIPPTTSLVINRAVGVVLSIWNMKNVIEVPVAFWKHRKYEGYIKKDATDAVVIGYAVVMTARKLEAAKGGML